MGNGLAKLLGGLALGAGAYYGGSALLGGSDASGLSVSNPGGNIGPTTSGIQALGLAPESTASSIFSNPTVLSSGILSATSLLGGLFGNSATEDANALTAEEAKRQFDAKLALEQAQLAQNLEVAKLQLAARGGGGGGGGNGAAVAAQLRIAKNNAIAQNAAQKIAALQLPGEMGQARIGTAQNTGAQSRAGFNQMASILQAPALRSA